MRKRYINFAEQLYPKILNIMVAPMSEDQANKAIQKASLDVLSDSGFRAKPYNKNGEINKKAKRKAKELLKLPPVQSYMTQKFAEHGLDAAKAAGVLNSIVDMYSENPTVALSALNVFFKYTLPPQAQTMQVVQKNLNVNTDLQTYNKSVWNEDVDITLDDNNEEIN